MPLSNPAFPRSAVAPVVPPAGPVRRGLLLAAGIGLLPPRLAAATPCCGPVTAAGQALAAFLDTTGVDRLWQAHWHVDWRTGEHDRLLPGGREAATHCSAFAAAVADRLGIYLLRPPEHPQELLANAQLAWLRGAGAAQGWQPVDGMQAAQALANRGALVLAAFEAPDPRRPGHIAVLRPSLKDAAALDAEGPQVTQAGATNFLSVSLAEGFRHHAGAWEPGGTGAVRYYAHAVAPRLPGSEPGA